MLSINIILTKYTRKESGESAYDVWKRLGNEGTEADFLEFIRSGPKGEKGDPAYTYGLAVSENVMKLDASDVLVPASITFSGYYRIGIEATRYEYAGKLVIQETTNGSTWETKYESDANEYSKIYVPSSHDVKFIKCILYSSVAEDAIELDTQSVAVLTDTETIVAILSNDAHVIATDSEGNGGDFSECNSSIQVFSGTTDVTNITIYDVIPSDGITGSWDLANYTYTVTDLSVDTGYVDIIATHKGVSVIKRFTVTKSKTGKSAYEVWLEIEGNEGKTEQEFLTEIVNKPLNATITSTKTELKSYTDDKVAAEAIARETANNGIKTELKSYTDNQIEEFSENVAFIEDENNDIIADLEYNLTTNHIVDNVESSNSRLVLSAKQGKMLNSRISNIIAHNNDTEGNTELLDIRVGTDGTTYDSAGDAVRAQVNQLSGEIEEISTNEVGNNKIIYDTFVVAGEVGATRNFDADVYLENGKTYNLRMYEKAITSSQINIQNKTTKEDIVVVVNFEAVKTTGIDFTWNYETGYYNYHQLTGSANSVPSQDIIDSLIISEKEKGLIEWEKGEISLIAKKSLMSKNSALLNGYNVNEIVEMAKTDSLLHNVSCVGDSLTQGAGAPSHNIVNQLNQHFLNEQTAYRFGVGGESSTKIAMRQGGLPTYVMPTTIPSDTVAVEIQIKDGMGNNVQFGNLNGLLFGVETCYIQGVKGTLSISDDKTHTYFTRLESGDSVVIERPTLFVSEIAHDHLNDVFVFWCGTNDDMSKNGTAKTMSVIDDMIGLLPHNRYIVVGMTSEQYMSNIDDINNEFMNHFGNHFLNVRKYLEDYGLLDNGLSDDSNTIYNDSAIPDALYADGTHFNQYGYYSVAKAIYLFGKDKGYFA